jgi:Zn-dependent protease with chaperone function
MLVAQGKLFAGSGANYQIVKVKLHASGILCYTDANDDIVEYKHEELIISDKLGTIPREIILPNKTLLVMNSEPFLDSWLSAGKKDVSKWEKSAKAVIGSIVAIPVTLYFIFAVVIPQMAVVFAPYIPDVFVELSSRHTMTAMDKTVLNPSEADLEKITALESQWYSLLANMDLDSEKYNILFRHTKMMGPNAFALPNGTIVFTDQLLELVDYDEEILTAIFMHEIGHVENHHSMRLISQTLATSIAITYIFGDVSGFFDFFASVSNTIATNQFTQKLEWEADEFALEQLRATGAEPVSFARGMKKFAEYADSENSLIAEDLEKILSSHPLTKERIANALEFAGVSESAFADMEVEIQKNKDALKAQSETEFEQLKTDLPK